MVSKKSAQLTKIETKEANSTIASTKKTTKSVIKSQKSANKSQKLPTEMQKSPIATNTKPPAKKMEEKSTKSNKEGSKIVPGETEPTVETLVTGKSTKSKKIMASVILVVILCMIVGVIIVVALTQADDVATTMEKITTTMPYVPLPKDVRGLPNLTSECRKEGYCWTFAERFVDSCDAAVHCKSLNLTPHLVEENGAVKLQFSIDADDRFDMDEHKQNEAVLTYTPCKIENTTYDYGWCINKKCIKPSKPEELQILDDYKNLPKIDGVWEAGNQTHMCISTLRGEGGNYAPDDQDIWEANYLYKDDDNGKCSNDTKNCKPYLFHFRSCTASEPQLGGKDCWERGRDGWDRGRKTMNDFVDVDILSFPLVIFKDCTKICPPPNTTKPDCTQPNPPLSSCNFNYTILSATKIPPTDWKPCCYSKNESAPWKNGLCFFGQCLPTNFMFR